MSTLKTVLLVLQSLAMIAGLVALVGGLLYAFSWMMLSLVQFFPVIGRKHRHGRWEELNPREAERTNKADSQRERR
jgi:hypothetical protein